MTIDPWRTPVVLGVGQHTDHGRANDALDLAAAATRAAFDDAPGVEAGVDRLVVVGMLAGGGQAPAAHVAALVGVEAPTATTTIGGNTPQWLVGQAADDIAAGQAGTVVICGAEALASFRSGRLAEARPPLPADPVVGDPRSGLSELEAAAGLAVPAQVYPMFEAAIAARAGRSLAEHRTALGELLAPFTEVAARHPAAWRREVLRPEDIAEPSSSNPLMSEPYPKRMHASLYVDQGAAIVLTSLGRARELGLADQAVFVVSQADANDVWFPSARPDPSRSPGLAAAGRGALAAAGAGIEEMGWLDLYSCFPCAVEMAAEALGLDDGRVPTVTGGLPFFGGPGNNYTTHAIATMAERLRASTEPALGLVSGLGWYVTKHSVGIYGNRPAAQGYRRADVADAQRSIDATALPVIAASDGEAGTVAAAAVLYGTDGEPVTAPAIVDLPGGRRAVAQIDPDDLAAAAGTNVVGAVVRVTGRPPSYHVVELAAAAR